MPEIKPLQIFLLGGPLMWPILLCSVFALAIVIEKLVFFHGLRENVVDLKDRIFTAVRKNDIKGAMVVCDLSGTPVSRILKSGLLHYGRSKADIEAAMENVSRYEVPLLEERMPTLLAIGQVAPLLGLLGTVIGMCSLFHTMSLRAQALNQLMPGSVAGGLWEALITTAAGLMVAIPCVLAHSYLVGCQTDYVVLMERTAADLAHFLDHIMDPDQNDNRG